MIIIKKQCLCKMYGFHNLTANRDQDFLSKKVISLPDILLARYIPHTKSMTVRFLFSKVSNIIKIHCSCDMTENGQCQWWIFRLSHGVLSVIWLKFAMFFAEAVLIELKIMSNPFPATWYCPTWAIYSYCNCMSFCVLGHFQHNETHHHPLIKLRPLPAISIHSLSRHQSSSYSLLWI